MAPVLFDHSEVSAPGIRGAVKKPVQTLHKLYLMAVLIFKKTLS